MKWNTSLEWIFLLFIVISIVHLGCCAPKNKANVTNKIVFPSDDQPIQPKGMDAYSAAEMCSKYSELIYNYVKDPVLLAGHDNFIKVKDCHTVLTLIVNGTRADPKEFPHMALLGYSKNPKSNAWACGGSLISNRWILSAAHCEKLDDKTFVRWARLGELNYLSETDDARPMDYQIDQRVVHPNYQPPSLYNDIALFHLDQEVKFSAYVRPICLNADPKLQSSPSQTLMATGWGQIYFNGPASPDLLKVTLNMIPADLCKSNYASIGGTQLANGILEESMMCAGYANGEKDTCGGDSGGPLQIAHSNYSCMYTQVGITSFGKLCAKKNSPGVYTRVSKFLPWIEHIVWPKMSA
ncbi:hypothetical protein ACI65C_009704 [Semiaphis heraclei]